jgi:hypothetical protein
MLCEARSCIACQQRAYPLFCLDWETEASERIGRIPMPTVFQPDDQPSQLSVPPNECLAVKFSLPVHHQAEGRHLVLWRNGHQEALAVARDVEYVATI